MAKCAQNHSFDYAKEGYLNLLLSNQRHSKNPGDSGEMIASRHMFLESGVYQAIAEKLGEMIIENGQKSGLNILDCGCGEGYFTRQLSQKERFDSSNFYGVDISKSAIKCAAKNNKQERWIIGNIMQKLPIKTGAMDVVLSILAPRHIEEIERVLSDNGFVIIGIPGENHLIELRKLLLAEDKSFHDKSDKEIKKFSPLFECNVRDEVVYKERLTNEQLSHLSKMTPMYWNTSKKMLDETLRLDTLDITVHFKLLLFIKKGEKR